MSGRSKKLIFKIQIISPIRFVTRVIKICGKYLFCKLAYIVFFLLTVRVTEDAQKHFHSIQFDFTVLFTKILFKAVILEPTVNKTKRLE